VSVLAATNVYLLSARSQPITDYGYCTASVMLWVAAVPLWRFLITNRRSIPFMPFAALLYWMYYGFPVFSGTPMFLLVRSGAAWSAMDDAIGLALLGLVCMLLGVYGTQRLLARIPRVRREIDLRRSLPALALLSLISFIVRVAFTGTETRTFGSILFGFSAAGQIALGALVIAWLRGYLNAGYKILTFAMAAAIASACLATGLLATVALPMAGLLFVYGWERRRIPWAPVLVGILLFVPFSAAKHEFRQVAWHQSDNQLGPSRIPKLVAMFVSLTIDQLESDPREWDDPTQVDRARGNELAMLAMVVSETPQDVPYWDGYTYSDLVWHLIPRVLVPDKPSPPIGQEFPRRYGLIDYRDYETSVNLAQLIELYINFGPAGVVAGMGIIGLLYGLLDHLFAASSCGAVIGGVIFSNLMNMESNFSLVFGGIPYFALLFYALLRLFPDDPPGHGAPV